MAGERITDLILRGGEIAAEGTRRRGELWGDVVSNVGNAAGDYFQQRNEKKKEERATAEMAKRDAKWTQVVEGWDGKDPKALFQQASRIFDPKTAVQMTQAVVSFQSMTGKGDAEDEEHVNNLATALSSGKISPQMWDRWGQGIQQKVEPIIQKKFGGAMVTPEDPALQAERDPMGMEAQKQPWTYEQAMEGAKALVALRGGQQGEGFTLSPGQVRYGPDGKPVASAPQEAPKGPKLQLEETADGLQTFNPETGELGPVIGKGKPQPERQPAFQAKEVLDESGRAVMANFDARTGRYISAETGQPIKNPRPVPTAEETKDTRKFKQAEPILSSVAELSERINTLQGVMAKVSGGVERAKAEANLNDDVAEYEALISGFTPLVARALGHSGVLTEQDVQSVKALFPRPGDSKSLRDRKISRIKSIIGQLEAGGSGAAPKGNKPGKVGRFTVEVE